MFGPQIKLDSGIILRPRFTSLSFCMMEDRRFKFSLVLKPHFPDLDLCRKTLSSISFFFSLSNEIFNLLKLIYFENNVGCYGDLGLSVMYCLYSITPMVCLDTWSPSGLQMSSAGMEYINILNYILSKFCLFYTTYINVYDILSTIHEKKKESKVLTLAN